MAAQQANLQDPFDCFGDDDDDDDEKEADDGDESEENPSATNDNDKMMITRGRRDPSCGTLTFHNGTEQALYNYVQREMDNRQKTTSENNQVQDEIMFPPAKQVLRHIDHFCYRNHWMMHVGPDKGKTLIEFLQGEFCKRYFPSYSSSSEEAQEKDTEADRRPLILVELGTYCGYSAILTAQTILDFCETTTTTTTTTTTKLTNATTTTNTKHFHIVSVDVDPNHQKVAQKLVRLANLQEYISFLLLPTNNNNDDDGGILTNCLAEHFHSIPSLKRKRRHDSNSSSIKKKEDVQIHFLFIDHDKDLYVSDLKQLEQSGWIRTGTHVAADNVVFFDIPYRSYIQQRKEQGIVSSRLVQGQLEYVLPGEGEEGNFHNNNNNAETEFEDGIELSIYLKDPPSS